MVIWIYRYLWGFYRPPTSWGLLGLLLGMGVIAGSCAVKVNTIYDESAHFEQYQRFCWFDNCQFSIDGPVYVRKDSATVAQFQQAIVEELESKGFIYDPNNPDFLLHMHVVVKEQEAQVMSPYGTGEPGDWQGVIPLAPWEDQIYHYLEGSLIIDIADAETSSMVWRSDAVEYLDLTTDITDSRLRKGVKKVLRKFPPKQQ